MRWMEEYSFSFDHTLEQIKIRKRGICLSDGARFMETNGLPLVGALSLLIFIFLFFSLFAFLYIFFSSIFPCRFLILPPRPPFVPLVALVIFGWDAFPLWETPVAHNKSRKSWKLIRLSRKHLFVVLTIRELQAKRPVIYHAITSRCS